MNVQNASPIVDSYGRVHRNLRLSVTDRCNIRCFYCMPADQVEFLPRKELLTFEEITRFVEIVARLGVHRVRLTGGEPLVRKDVSQLVSRLARINGIEDIAMTTNGLLLADHAEELRDAGLSRLNISLDGLQEETFRRISRRSGIDKVVAGIDKAIGAGFKTIRLNAVSIAGITEKEVLPLARFAKERSLELRFIEFMPLDAENSWQQELVLSGETVKSCLESELGPLIPAKRTDPSQPSQDFVFKEGGGTIGFINPVSQPFCSDCNRLRLTAEGQLRNCLFSTKEWDIRQMLRGGADEPAIERQVRDCVAVKKAAHGIDSTDFERPEKSMYQIGG
ncbi:MAG: GTP 3',8-cyclase MoaA [Planctomycetota bacterium]|nr:GTP 3',8-cyclase MoaA [Planctomycetota bacterium]